MQYKYFDTIHTSSTYYVRHYWKRHFRHNYTLAAANSIFKYMKVKEDQHTLTLKNTTDMGFTVGADASVIGSLGNTSVLATVVINNTKSSQRGVLPLTVDYVERTAAAGAFPWFNKYQRKERMSNEHAMLLSRAVDRSLRPMFPKGFFYDTSITLQLLSFDHESDVTSIAINAASAALSVCSETICLADGKRLFPSPVGAVRVAGIKGKDKRKSLEVIVNPSEYALQKREAAGQRCDFHFLLSSLGQDRIVMLEGEGDHVSKTKLLSAIQGAGVFVEEALAIQQTFIDQLKDSQHVEGISEGDPRKTVSLEVEQLDPKLASLTDMLFYDAALAMILSPRAMRKERGMAQSSYYKLALDTLTIYRQALSDYASDASLEHVSAFIGAPGHMLEKAAEETLRRAIRDAAMQTVNTTLKSVSSLNHSLLQKALIEARDMPSAKGAHLVKAWLSLALGDPPTQQAITPSPGEAIPFSRPDGRARDEVRKVSCELDIFPTPHGSALFSRGETQVAANATISSTQFLLGKPSDITPGKWVTGYDEEHSKAIYLHYDFPSFAVNRGGPTQINRRAVGHGNLAEMGLKGLSVLLQPDADLPKLTLRLDNCVLASDGSTSMASVAASSLAFADALLKDDASSWTLEEIEQQLVAGLSIGLHLSPEFFSSTSDRASSPERSSTPEVDGSRRKFKVLKAKRSSTPGAAPYVTLVDILGMEDHFGAMDFKIAGSDTGVTSFQLDIKAPFVSLNVIESALSDAEEGRKTVLSSMRAALRAQQDKVASGDERRFDFQYEEVTSSVSDVAALIGKRGINLKQIECETGVTLVLKERVHDSSKIKTRVFVYADQQSKRQAAKELIGAN